MNTDDQVQERAPFKTVNADDNPMDKNGKTKRDYEVEKTQQDALKGSDHDAGRRDANGLEEKDRDGQRHNPVGGGSYDRSRADLTRAAGELDPRNATNEASRRPPVPGVDKPLGGSSDGPYGAGQGGSAPDPHKYPNPNPNNPDSPNNPASTALTDRLASSPTPPVPVGKVTTEETPMDGKSEAQREDEAKRKDDDKSKGAKDDKDAKKDKKK